MKKLFYLFLTSSLFVFNGCSSDDLKINNGSSSANVETSPSVDGYTVKPEQEVLPREETPDEVVLERLADRAVVQALGDKTHGGILTDIFASQLSTTYYSSKTLTDPENAVNSRAIGDITPEFSIPVDTGVLSDIINLTSPLILSIIQNVIPLPDWLTGLIPDNIQIPEQVGVTGEINFGIDTFNIINPLALKLPEFAEVGVDLTSTIGYQIADNLLYEGDGLGASLILTTNLENQLYFASVAGGLTDILEGVAELVLSGGDLTSIFNLILEILSVAPSNISGTIGGAVELDLPGFDAYTYGLDGNLTNLVVDLSKASTNLLEVLTFEELSVSFTAKSPFGKEYVYEYNLVPGLFNGQLILNVVNNLGQVIENIVVFTADEIARILASIDNTSTEENCCIEKPNVQSPETNPTPPLLL